MEAFGKSHHKCVIVKLFQYNFIEIILQLHIYGAT